MSLQVWLPLNGDLENRGLADTSAISSTDITFQNNGKIGKCATGKSGNFNIPVMTGKKKLTVTGWIKVNTIPSTTMTLLMWRVKYDGENGSAAEYIECTSGSKLDIYYTFNSDGNRSYTWTNSIPYVVGSWIHVACVEDHEKGFLKFYVNGVLIDFVTNVYQEDYLTGAFQIGSNIDACYNDFRIYDHCLSEKEVKELSKGLVAHYPLNDFIGNPNLIPNTGFGEKTCPIPQTGSYKDYFYTATSIIPTGSIYVLSFEARADRDNTLMCTHYYSPNTTTTAVSSQGRTGTRTDGYMPFRISTEWAKYWVVYNQNTTSAVKHVICPRLHSKTGDASQLDGEGNVYIRNVKLEEGSVATPWIPAETDALYSELGLDDTTIYDTSGYGHNGTLSPTPPTVNAESIRYSSCAEFNGSNNYIDLGKATWLPTDEITVSLWGYMDTWGSSRLISCTEGGGFNFEQGDGGGWRFPVYKAGTGYSYSVPVKKWASYTPGWHLITGTFDGYVSRIYIDGELDSVATNASPTVKKAIGYNTNAKFFIGCEAVAANPGSPWFRGKISDVRVYCTALSPEDIKELYEVSASIDDKGNVYAYELSEG